MNKLYCFNSIRMTVGNEGRCVQGHFCAASLLGRGLADLESLFPFYDSSSRLFSWHLHCWPVGSERYQIIFLQVIVWLTLQACAEQQQYGRSSRNLSKAIYGSSCCKPFSFIFSSIPFFLPWRVAKALELQGLWQWYFTNKVALCTAFG